MNGIVGGLTLLVLSAAAYTDLKHRRIPNLLTYVGIGVAICFAVTVDWQAVVEPNPFQTVNVSKMPLLPGMEPNQITFENESVPAEPLATCCAFAGALGCFTILLLNYLCGGLGGGDVKLGAFLGAANGFQVGVSILCFGHLLAGALLVSQSIFFKTAIAVSKNSMVRWDAEKIGSCEHRISAKGLPMAVCYLLGTLIVFVSGVTQ